MKIIFNADDFGHSKGVNLGIIEAYQHGVVRSTTMMAGMPGFEHAITLARGNKGLGIGVHLTLTSGKSVGGVYETITDEAGNFFSLADLTNKISELDLEEVEREWEAQIQKIVSAGIEIDHLDSHHHIHNLDGVVTIFLKLAKKYCKMVRINNKELLCNEYAHIKTTDIFDDSFYDEKATLDHLKEIIQGSKAGSMEIMCHPAYVGYTLCSTSSYNIKRVFELHTLVSDELKQYLEQNQVEILSYRGLLDNL